MLPIKIAAVFLAATSVGILYRIPRDVLAYASLTGCLSWLAAYGAASHGGNGILAVFLGSLVAGIISEGLARRLKKPATVFVIPGFIPLVPGREAYMTMLFMVEGQYMDGVAMAMKTLLMGGSIAFGIFVSSTVYRLGANYLAGRNGRNAGQS